MRHRKRLVRAAVLGGLLAVGLAAPARALSQSDNKPCQPWSSNQRAVGTFIDNQGAAPFTNWC